MIIAQPHDKYASDEHGEKWDDNVDAGEGQTTVEELADSPR